MSAPHPAGAAAAAVFGGLSTLRRRRSLHPDGASYHATVHIDGDTDLDGAPLGEDAGERLRFNPWNTGGGIRPAGPFQGLRDPAYSASQRARLST
jgi:hypothetical protein